MFFIEKKNSKMLEINHTYYIICNNSIKNKIEEGFSKLSYKKEARNNTI